MAGRAVSTAVRGQVNTEVTGRNEVERCPTKLNAPSAAAKASSFLISLSNYDAAVASRPVKDEDSMVGPCSGTTPERRPSSALRADISTCGGP